MTAGVLLIVTKNNPEYLLLVRAFIRKNGWCYFVTKIVASNEHGKF